MKNPNGFGTVTQLSGSRRKPWIVKVTVGYDKKTGKQKQKSLGTFATRPEALKQLALYNATKENEDLMKSVNINISKREVHTFKECVLAVIERDKDKKSKKWFQARNNSLKNLSDIADEDISVLDLFTIQECINKIRREGKSKSTLTACKVTCNFAFEYAVMHKYIGPLDNYSKYIDTTSDAERTVVHKPFTEDEISMIVKDDSFMSKVVLVYILTGCRSMELTNVDRYENYIVCGSKTKNGKNRKIPIHSYIEPFIDEVLKYLNGISYNKVSDAFEKYMNTLNIEHTMHDTRNTFATLGKEHGMKLSVIKKIIGHSLGDITEDIYTHESIEYLKKEIEKIQIY